MGVEVGHRHAGVEELVELRRELTTEVIGIDRAHRGASHELLPGEREPTGGIHERRDLASRQEWRVLAHCGEVGADGEPGVSQRVGVSVEGRRHHERRGGGDGAAFVGLEHSSAHACGEAEIVSVDDQDPAVIAGITRRVLHHPEFPPGRVHNRAERRDRSVPCPQSRRTARPARRSASRISGAPPAGSQALRAGRRSPRIMWARSAQPPRSRIATIAARTSAEPSRSTTSTRSADSATTR